MLNISLPFAISRRVTVLIAGLCVCASVLISQDYSARIELLKQRAVRIDGSETVVELIQSLGFERGIAYVALSLAATDQADEVKKYFNDYFKALAKHHTATDDLVKKIGGYDAKYSGVPEQVAKLMQLRILASSAIRGEYSELAGLSGDDVFFKYNTVIKDILGTHKGMLSSGNKVWQSRSIEMNTRLSMAELINEIGRLRALGAVIITRSGNDQNYEMQMRDLSSNLNDIRAKFAKLKIEVEDGRGLNITSPIITPSNVFLDQMDQLLATISSTISQNKTVEAARLWFDWSTQVISLLRKDSGQLRGVLKNARDDASEQASWLLGSLWVLIGFALLIIVLAIAESLKYIKSTRTRIPNVKILNKYSYKLLRASERLIAERGISKAILLAVNDQDVQSRLKKKRKELRLQVNWKMAELEIFIREEMTSISTGSIARILADIEKTRVNFSTVEQKKSSSDRAELEVNAKQIFSEYTKIFTKLEETFGVLATEFMLYDLDAQQHHDPRNKYARSITELASIRWLIARICEEIGVERAQMTTLFVSEAGWNEDEKSKIEQGHRHIIEWHEKLCIAAGYAGVKIKHQPLEYLGNVCKEKNGNEGNVYFESKIRELKGKAEGKTKAVAALDCFSSYTKMIEDVHKLSSNISDSIVKKIHGRARWLISFWLFIAFVLICLLLWIFVKKLI